MNPFYLLTIISLMLMSSTATFAEPYYTPCGAAIEKVYKARKALPPPSTRRGTGANPRTGGLEREFVDVCARRNL